MVIETLPQLFARGACLGRREALRWVGDASTTRLSYESLSNQVESTIAALSGLGLSPGDRLVLWAANSPEWVAAFWAAQHLGVAVVPIDPGYSPEFVHSVLKQTGAVLLLHDLVSSPGLAVAEQRLQALDLGSSVSPPPLPRVSPDDVAQIVFTSGTTREPRGVVLRHRQICANLQGMAPEFDRYRWLAYPFQPVRILNPLPLGHMLGQAMSLFIPLLLGGASVLVGRALGPAELVAVLRRERVSVLVAVPRILQQLREHLEQSGLASASPPEGKGAWGAFRRWVRYRRLHRTLGWKFWAVVSGGATCPSREEEFWSRVGILLIQGYGLTEAAPVVALNHPFSVGRGAVGKVLPGQEVRLAPDGEILVRGASVSTEYVGAGREASEGWLHTGDLGEFDSAGRLYFRGRKEDLIVTSSGANVYPDDVEAALEAQSGIDAACVIARDRGHGEEVHAVLISGLDATQLARLVGQANRRLEPHQRVRSWSRWRERDFPRTPSTLKVRRALVRAGSGESEVAEEGRGAEPLSELARSLAGPRLGEGQDQVSLDDLGLSSLDRVELLGRLEEQAGKPLDEAEYSSLRTLGEVRDWLQAGEQGNGQGVDWPPLPRWPRRFPWTHLRKVAQSLFHAIVRWKLDPRVSGIEHLPRIPSPVIFAANHESHLDTPVLLACLPVGWCERVVPAARLEFFAGRFFADRCSWGVRVRDRLLYFVACLLFQIVPLPQRSAGMRTVMRFCERLAAQGCSILIFPEGERTAGILRPLKSGAVVMARRLGIPLVPVFMEGMGDVFPPGSRWPRRAAVKVWFGPPQMPREELSSAEAAAAFEGFYREWTERLRMSGSSDHRGS